MYCLAYELTKIGYNFREKEDQNWKESKNVTNEKCSTKSVSLKMIKINSRMIKFTSDIGIGIEIKIEFEKNGYFLFFILQEQSPQVKSTNICLHRSNFLSKILVLVGCDRLSFTSVVILYGLLHRVWIFWKHVGFHASHFLFVKINRLSPNYGPVQCTWPMEYGPLVELLSLLFIFNLHFSCIIATISQSTFLTFLIIFYLVSYFLN